MYPMLSPEMLSESLQIMCYLSTVLAALVSCLLTMRC